MHSGRLIFAQLMDYIPRYAFDQCVLRYSGNYKVQHFSCRNQFICMAFGQLTYRNGLRDIITCLRANKSKLYHIGIKGNVSLNNLSNANMNRDWRIYADFAQVLIATARDLYCDEQFSEEISETVYALDSSTISLSLSLFPWAKFRKYKSGIKLHTLMELPSSIPTVIDITEAKPHDVNFLDRLIIEQGAIYVMDLGYMDYERLFRITKSNAYFAMRVKSNAQLKRRYSRKKDSSAGILSDQVVVAKSATSFNKYPAPLRRIRYRDPEDGRILIFLTNNFELSALSITQLYKARWQIELFFKWIKQHLRIKAFWGYTENSVKTQIWIAVSVYVLVAIIRKRLDLEEYSLYNILQVLSVTPFCYDELAQLFSNAGLQPDDNKNPNQLSLFDL